MIGSDIRLEKGFEAVLREIVATIGPELAEQCPAVLTLDRALEILKETSNEEIAIELGIKSIRDWKCPCQRRKD